MSDATEKEKALQVLQTLLREGRSVQPQNYQMVYERLFGTVVSSANDSTPPLARILPEFLGEWERSQQGLSHLQKMQALRQQLSHSNSDQAAEVLQNLTQQWQQRPSRSMAESEPPNTTENASAQNIIRLLWQRSLRQGFFVGLDQAPINRELFEQTESLLQRENFTVDDFLQNIRGLWTILDLYEQKQQNTIQNIHSALHLLFSGGTSLLPKDPWLAQQLSHLDAYVAGQKSAEKSQEMLEALRALLYQHEQRREPVQAADRALQELLQLAFSVIETLNTGSTENYRELAELSAQIERSDDIGVIRELVGKVLQRSRSLQEILNKSRDALQGARQQLQSSEARLRTMEQEISVLNLLVHQDPLTKTLNRRGLQMAFERESARAKRQQIPLSLTMLDLDHFKKINDEHGHETGDAVLCHIASLLTSALRAEDIVARFGGEEFVILMPGTSARATIDILQRIQSRLQASPCRVGPVSLQPTFSAGVTTWQPGFDLERSIADADQALYRAKREGRNRIVLDERIGTATGLSID
ncbi:MAG: diguanylate cyclase [Candidatus Igneacidithiobacillus chanchocoensis]